MVKLLILNPAVNSETSVSVVNN